MRHVYRPLMSRPEGPTESTEILTSKIQTSRFISRSLTAMACSTWQSILYLCLSVVLIASALQFVQCFKVTRNWLDSFPNLGCNNQSCQRTHCEKYGGECGDFNEDCSECDCGTPGGLTEVKRTYVSDGKGRGKCLAPSQLVQASVPKASVVISSPYKHPLSEYGHYPLEKCFRVNEVLDMSNCYDGHISLLWIYTKNRQFLNLNRLECLDVEDPMHVKTAPCKLDNEYQKWECAKSSDPKYPDRLYQPRKGKNDTFLDYYAYDVHKPRLVDAEGKCKQCKWGAYNRTRPAENNRSLCATPVDYQGCYSFNPTEYDRQFVRDLYVYFDTDTCERNCFKSFIVWAPIFVENTNCVVVWQRSSFLANNQPWKSLATFNNEGDFSVSNAMKDSRGINLKVSYRAYKQWAGTVMKLQVQCSSIDSSTSEEHCVLLKFHGQYSDNKDSPLSKSAYKASTIALSVIVALLCLGLAVAIFMVLRRKGKHAKLGANYDDGREPVCERDEHAQI